jgi:hypothetical protein
MTDVDTESLELIDQDADLVLMLDGSAVAEVLEGCAS